MSKLTLQGLLIICLFLVTWHLLKQVNWVHLFRIEVLTEKTEEKLGELYLELFKSEGKESADEQLFQSIDSLIERICDSNQIQKDQIKLHILEKDEVNAFALPHGHLVIYTGLVHYTENEDELSGVLAHEIAHIQMNHVTRKLIKEVGLGALISVTTGGAGPELLKETARILSSTAFDRSMEKEADLQGVAYLIQAGMNPDAFAHFLERLADQQHEMSHYLSWINTHPNPEERAAYILDYIKSNP